MFFISTYTEGAPPDSAKWFCQWLAEAVDDFRVSKSLLSKLHYTVFSLGNSLYKDHYSTVGNNLFDRLSRLSGVAIYPLGLGDQNVAESDNGGESSKGGGSVISMVTVGVVCSLAGIEEDFKAWKNGFVRDVFPALRGAVPLTGLTGVSGASGGVSAELCGCRKKAKQECCKDQATTTDATVQSHDTAEVPSP